MSEKRVLYRKKIIRELYFSSALSCAELSEKVFRSLALTTGILNELIAEGYVVETGHAASTGGRRAIMYSLKNDVMYIVSVAMDQFVTRIAILDMRNAIASDVVKFELSLARNPEALQIVTKKINQAIEESGVPKEKIAGIGIGMPGFVDYKMGTNYSFLQTSGKSIRDYISSHTNLPVYIDNDSSLIALAELRFGAARGKQNAMVLNLGWGIGLGMILNGELFRGHNAFAGEFSHIPIFSNGKLCSCGKCGCLETETSLLVLIEKAKNGLVNNILSMLDPALLQHYELASESIIKAVKEGDRYAIELFSESAYNIGRGAAILVHILNPETIILSGRASTAGRVWQAPIQQAINEHCIPRLSGNLTIELSTLGYQAELIGAAALVLDHFEKESGERPIVICRCLN